MIGWWTAFCKVKRWTSYKSDIIIKRSSCRHLNTSLQLGGHTDLQITSVIKGVKGWFLCAGFTISTTVLFFYHSCCTEEPYQHNDYARFFRPLISWQHKSESKSNNYYIHFIWIILIPATHKASSCRCVNTLLLIVKRNNWWSGINLKHTWG